MGEGKLFHARLPEPCASFLFSDHFVLPVTDSLLFLNKWKREKIHEKMCVHACVDFGSTNLQKTQLQCPMGCQEHHAILCNPNRFIFGDTKNFWY